MHSTEFNSLDYRLGHLFHHQKKSCKPPSNTATLKPRRGPLVLAPIPAFPALAVALRGLASIGINSVRYFTAMWFAQRRWWLTGGDIEISPRLTRRGFFCPCFHDAHWIFSAAKCKQTQPTDNPSVIHCHGRLGDLYTFACTFIRSPTAPPPAGSVC